MLKKEIKSAISAARKTGEAQRVGRWTITTERVYSPGIGYAWHTYYYARPDELRCNLGGVTHADTLADMILRADRAGDTFSEYPAHSRAVS